MMPPPITTTSGKGTLSSWLTPCAGWLAARHAASVILRVSASARFAAQALSGLGTLTEGSAPTSAGGADPSLRSGRQNRVGEPLDVLGLGLERVERPPPALVAEEGEVRCRHARRVDQ